MNHRQSTTTPPPVTSFSLTATSSLPPKRRKIKYTKVYGYIIDPIVINKLASEKGTAIEGQFGRTFSMYRDKLCDFCGIDYEDILSVRNPEQNMPPVYCIPVATNLSKQSRIPNQHIINKAKDFLEVSAEPKWYYVVKD